MIIECENITAEYRSKIKQHLYNLKYYLQKQSIKPRTTHPLFNLSCTFTQGVNILLGPNGAGKSTLISLLAGNLKPCAGAIRFDEHVITPLELRRLISYLPQNFDLYPEFTAYEMLDYISLLKGIATRKCRAQTIEEALAATNLLPNARQKVKTYSRGMKQRLGIAQILLTDTPVILLDEPTAGLDPEERSKFRALIRRLSQVRLVVFSSSILTDIVCADTAVILNEGLCRFTGTPAALSALAKPTILTQINGHSSFTASLTKGYQTVLSQVNVK
jgi:ABC-type multidrug transport system ATPase subunit